MTAGGADDARLHNNKDDIEGLLSLCPSISSPRWRPLEREERALEKLWKSGSTAIEKKNRKVNERKYCTSNAALHWAVAQFPTVVWLVLANVPPASLQGAKCSVDASHHSPTPLHFAARPKGGGGGGGQRRIYRHRVEWPCCAGFHAHGVESGKDLLSAEEEEQ